MLESDVVRLTEGASDPAYAVDGFGSVVAWNRAAEEEFGIPAAEALSKRCYNLIRGKDEDGAVCCEECVVRKSASNRTPVKNFDLRIETPKGLRWFNISPLSADVVKKKRPYVIHIARLIDVSKRMEILVRDLVMRTANVTEDSVTVLLSSNRSAARSSGLTRRETEILRLVAKGKSSQAISADLLISAATVDSHIEHILKKLGVHSRLEAVLRAEHSGLL